MARPLFTQGCCNDESDNAPTQKQQSDYVRDTCRVMYMEGIKYINLIKIGPIAIEIWGIENG